MKKLTNNHSENGMKTSILAIFCLTVAMMSTNVLATGNRTGAHARHSRTQSSGSFKGEMKNMFKSIGHGFRHGGHAIRGVARHTGRRVKAGIHAAKRQR